MQAGLQQIGDIKRWHMEAIIDMIEVQASYNPSSGTEEWVA